MTDATPTKPRKLLDQLRDATLRFSALEMPDAVSARYGSIFSSSSTIHGSLVERRNRVGGWGCLPRRGLPPPGHARAGRAKKRSPPGGRLLQTARCHAFLFVMAAEASSSCPAASWQALPFLTRSPSRPHAARDAP